MTLDEVIAELEDEGLFADALYYLKEYRSLDSLDAVAFPEDDNPAMTWNELKGMEGKPVWVEMEGYKHNWGIVMNQDERNGRLCLCGYDKVPIRIEINEDGEGKTWQAYRKERS